MKDKKIITDKLICHMDNYIHDSYEESLLSVIKDCDKSKAYSYYKLAKYKNELLQYKESEEYFKKAIEIDPDNKEYQEQYERMLKEKAF